eukprot:c4490_g1_i1.p1 GENE.c4490_g1_i1~~c4490_g1_i1.p1  ORF type:complete len:151 (-),score=35.76 c4490_g1_i1:18-470(-)
MDCSVETFSDVFKHAVCLSNSEVVIILNQQLSTRQISQQDMFHNTNFTSSLEHAKKFSRINNVAAVKEVRQLLRRHGFDEIEIALIANLCPTTTEEAKKVIPTLAHRRDEDLEPALAELQNFRSYDVDSAALVQASVASAGATDSMRMSQ